MAHDHSIVTLPIRSLRIGSRVRKDPGDIDSLVESIRSVGLLQPLVITEGNNLLAGGRRLEACKRLGWKEVPCVIPHSGWSLIQMLEAERDENTCRKDFTPSEAVAMGRVLEEKYRHAAKQEQEAAAARGRKTQSEKQKSDKPVPENFRKPSKDHSKETRSRVASAVGMSDRTYEKAKAVVESGNAEAIKQMDRTGKVDPAFRAVKPKPKPKTPPIADVLFKALRELLERVDSIVEQFGSAGDMLSSPAWKECDTGAFEVVVEEIATKFAKLNTEVREYVDRVEA